MELESLKRQFGIIGHSQELNIAVERAMRVAKTDLSVLIVGESGVGKEAFSKIIHKLSHRKHQAFIAVNCGAIPEGTIDSELFGHEKGAFTGATDQRKGYFETVDKGTIFLDEIGEMPVGTQARLLRLLESGEFIKVGSSKTQNTNVRVVAATNVDLLESVTNGKFRKDLYYRLNTVPINVPSLRERRNDIEMLFKYFVNNYFESNKTLKIILDPEAMSMLKNYTWPGNIRELKNTSELLSALANEPLLNKQMLLSLIPKLSQNNLPALHNNPELSSNNGGFQEREIMFKYLMDMKNDLNDLKKVTLKLMQINNVTSDFLDENAYDNTPQQNENSSANTSQYTPSTITLSSPTKETPIKNIELEEIKTLEAMEIDMITKTLKKHKNRRRDAALELGISERTLYRKISEHGL